MRDEIREVLVVRILDGTYPAGTQLKELSLAREFNVSQAPIREALRELEGGGLVTSERFRGTRVRGTDFREMRESYELRALLEVSAVEHAAPYGRDLLDALGAQLELMEASVEAGDPGRYIECALRFHRLLVGCSGNRTVLAIWDSLLWEIRGRIALRRFAETGRSLKPLLALHRTLLARMRAQDVAGAALAVRRILDRVVIAFDEERQPPAAPVPLRRRNGRSVAKA